MGVIAWIALGLLAAALPADDRGPRRGGSVVLQDDARPAGTSPIAIWPATSQLGRLTRRILWDPALRHRCRGRRRP